MIKLQHIVYRYLLPAVLCLPLLSLAQPAEQEQTILVLDASGSMWGKLGDETKIEAAKRVVGELVGGWSDDQQLGLTVYGHRRKGDCEDIEALLPVAAPDTAKFSAALNGITPTGKTPLSAAVRQAAEDLKFNLKKATVILVSDGEETCDADPCQVAQDLEAMAIDFTAHVIGFDIQDAATEAQLRCIAENTGGTYATANDADRLIESLRQAAGASVVAQPAQDAVALELTLVMSDGAEPIEQGVRFQAYDAEQRDDGSYRYVSTTHGGVGRLKLAPGNYRIVASYGATKVEDTVTVVADEVTKKQLVAGAGRLRLQYALSEDAEPLDKGVRFQVYEPEPDDRGNYQYITTDHGGVARFTLPVGSYRIVTTYGAAKNISQVEVVANQTTEKTIYAGAGRLHLQYALSEDAEPLEKGVRFQVYEPEPDDGGDYQYITTGRGGVARFTLPAGGYRIVTTYGSAKNIAQVEVVANQTTEKTIYAGAGRLHLQYALSEDSEPLEKDVRFQVYEAEPDGDGKYQYITTGRGGLARFTLPAGRYRIVTTYGSAKNTAEVEVTANETSEKTIYAGAGRLHLQYSLIDGGEPLDKDVSFLVYEAEPDDKGKYKYLTRKRGGIARFVLPAGTYRLVTEYGSATKAFELPVTTNQTLEQTLVGDAGRLHLEYALAEGQEPIEKQVRFSIYEAEPDDSGKYQYVAAVNGGMARFRLNAGRYRVTAKYGAAEMVTELDVTAGQTNSQTLVGEAGRLHLRFALTEGGPPVEKGVRYSIYQPEPDDRGKYDYITGDSKANARLVLPVGEYRIRVQHAGKEVISTAEVTPGGTTENTVVPE